MVSDLRRPHVFARDLDTLARHAAVWCRGVDRERHQDLPAGDSGMMLAPSEHTEAIADDARQICVDGRWAIGFEQRRVVANRRTLGERLRERVPLPRCGRRRVEHSAQ
jgi:hypothetical protein